MSESETASSASRPLERLLTVLECVLASEGRIALGTLAKSAEVPKATAYRLLTTLSNSGLLSTGSSDRYEPGPRLLWLLQMVRDPNAVATLARPALRRLVDATGETCYLTRLIGNRVVVVLMDAPQGRSYVLYVQPGNEMPAHAAATAKSILAFQPPAVVDAALAEPLLRLTEHTKCDRAAVLDEYRQIRDVGHAVCAGEMDDGLAALGVPIDVPGLGVMFSVGVTGPMVRILGNGRNRLIEALTRAAEELVPVLSLAREKS